MRTRRRRPARRAQPSCRSAASITCGVVGVEQVRRRTVVPALSAASSSTRLEMLFEPGRRTLPPTPHEAAEGRGSGSCTCGSRTRRRAAQRLVCGVEAFICQPLRASDALRISASSASALPVLMTCSMASSGCAEALRLLQDLFAVGHQDVAPDCRVAGGDAREVAKARARRATGSRARRAAGRPR